MSWQEYVDTSLIANGNFKQAALHGHDGSLWASTAAWSPSPSEIQTILKLFTSPDQEIAKVRSEGLHVNGKKFILLRSDERSIYGRSGNSGIIVVKTTQAILFGYYEAGTEGVGGYAKTIEELADYLIGVGY